MILCLLSKCMYTSIYTAYFQMLFLQEKKAIKRLSILFAHYNEHHIRLPNWMEWDSTYENIMMISFFSSSFSVFFFALMMNIQYAFTLATQTPLSIWWVRREKCLCVVLWCILCKLNGSLEICRIKTEHEMNIKWK